LVLKTKKKNLKRQRIFAAIPLKLRGSFEDIKTKILLFVFPGALPVQFEGIFNVEPVIIRPGRGI